MVRIMYLTIFILFMIIIIMSTTIVVNIKSVDDTVKIDVRIGFIRFVVPHQRLIGDLINKAKKESNIELGQDLKNFFDNRKYIKKIINHSSLINFYIAKFSKEDFYLNPFANAIYLISLGQIKSYLYNNFKLVDSCKIKLIKDDDYKNIDYFICIKTDFISLLTALMKGFKTV